MVSAPEIDDGSDLVVSETKRILSLAIEKLQCSKRKVVSCNGGTGLEPQHISGAGPLGI